MFCSPEAEQTRPKKADGGGGLEKHSQAKAHKLIFSWETI